MRLLAVLVLSALTTPAVGQTATETMAVLVFPKHSQTAEINGGKATLKDIKDSIIQTGDETIADFELEANDNCIARYTINHLSRQTKARVLKTVTVVDFSKLSELDMSGDLPAVLRGTNGLVCNTEFYFKEGKEVAGKPHCTSETTPYFFDDGDESNIVVEKREDKQVLRFSPALAQKYRRAFEYFRTTYCKGRAF